MKSIVFISIILILMENMGSATGKEEPELIYGFKKTHLA
jgi:phospholipase/carboxylesterase